MPEKKTKVKLSLKNLAMLPSYFNYIFVHLKQKACFKPELSSKFLLPVTLGPTRKARPDLQLWCQDQLGKSLSKIAIKLDVVVSDFFFQTS